MGTFLKVTFKLMFIDSDSTQIASFFEIEVAKEQKARKVNRNIKCL